MSQTPLRLVVLPATPDQHALDVARSCGGWVLAPRSAWKTLGGPERPEVVRVWDLTSSSYADRVRRMLQHDLLQRQPLRSRTVRLVVPSARSPVVGAAREALAGLGLPVSEEKDERGVTLVFASGDQGAGLVAASPAMRRLVERVDQLADETTPVLLVGPTGSGKGVLARALHTKSSRTGSYAALNAALLDPRLAESRLFGHRKGAFTGAEQDRGGRIDEALGGTFFLDEIFHLPARVQPKLLAALNRADEGLIRLERLGGRGFEDVEVRLVTAAQRHPLELQDDGVRDDLFYRIAGEVLVVPPLSERLEDLEALVRRELPDRSISDGAWEALRSHPWPGNLRELLVVLGRIQRRVPREGLVSRAVVVDSLGISPAALTARVELPSLKVQVAREELRLRNLALRLTGSQTAAAELLQASSNQWRRDMENLRDRAQLPEDDSP